MADILELFKQAAAEGWTELDLSGNQLVVRGEEMTKIRDLKSVYGKERYDPWRHRVKDVPPEIAKLTNLTSLDLRDNLLTSLPPEITKLTNLTSLNLRRNSLTSLPPEIRKLKKLTSLDLAENLLESVPPEITKLTNLTSLDLRGNQLMSLPPEIMKLTKLTWLNLTGNQLPTWLEFLNGAIKWLNLDEDQKRLSKDPNVNQLPIEPEMLADPRNVKGIFAAIAEFETWQSTGEFAAKRN